MWAGKISFDKLREKGRWKVEFFTGEGSSRSGSAFEATPLGEVLGERKEMLDPQQFPDHRFNYLGLENVASQTGDLVDFRPRPGVEIRSRSKVYRQGDILYGRLRPNLNKVYLVDEVTTEGICSGEFYVLTPDASKILPHFTRTVLASLYVQKIVSTMLTGSALPRLHLDDLLEIEIPLPSLAEQFEFEALIREETRKRRVLEAELADAQVRLFDAIVIGLESGRLPSSIERTFDQEQASSYDNPLPESRSKGRSSEDHTRK